MRKFESPGEIDSLTDDEARDVVRLARDLMVANVTATPQGLALDDMGDYLNGAITNYHRLFDAYWANDGDSVTFVQAVKDFLREDPNEWMGSDGEIRLALIVDPEDPDWSRTFGTD